MCMCYSRRRHTGGRGGWGGQRCVKGTGDRWAAENGGGEKNTILAIFLGTVKAIGGSDYF